MEDGDRIARRVGCVTDGGGAYALLPSNGVWGHRWNRPTLTAPSPVTFVQMGVTFRVGSEWQKAAIGAMPPGGVGRSAGRPPTCLRVRPQTWTLDPVALAPGSHLSSTTAPDRRD